RPRQRQAAPALAAPSPAVAAPAPAPAAARAAPAQIDLAADQPLDDQPPASADSPDVREAWLQRIRELRDDGRLDQARDSLHEFVRRHPQATVPDDLRPRLDRWVWIPWPDGPATPSRSGTAVSSPTPRRSRRRPRPPRSCRKSACPTPPTTAGPGASARTTAAAMTASRPAPRGARSWPPSTARASTA